MNDEQRKWKKQYSSCFGTREFLRLAIAILAWIFAGLAISSIVGSSTIFIAFFFVLFLFSFVSPRWKPAYSLLRKIIGNQNLPTEPLSHTVAKSSSQARVWWSYIPSIWWVLLDLILLYLVIKYLIK
jgi:hypothetical protein